jgi:hypothetical protein
VKVPDDDETEFLNVDLEVFSRENLAAFVKGLGKAVFVLHEGRWGRSYAACLEVGASGYQKNADFLIRRMVVLLKRMPPSARRLWNRATIKQFNVGIQAAFKPRGFELPIRAATLLDVARLGASIVVTVYAADLPGAETRVRPVEPRSRRTSA